ncbi:hypothetical protein OG407_49275 [Streptomyces sp. NBC_01515]|uniref:hypothetical protein n=1 Tax=Streptomyces sp. NBC_01515 TaxID=2903890 RepID=UPI00386B612E
MDTELTSDERLRARAALEAVIGNDDQALPSLAGSEHERPLPALFAAYRQHTLQRVWSPRSTSTPPWKTTKQADGSRRSTVTPRRASSFS